MRETIGQRIKRLRIAAGFWVGKDFARRVEIDPATLSLIENNRRRPSGDTVARMAVVLGTTRDLIMDGEPSAASKPVASTPQPPARPPAPERPKRTRAEPAAPALHDEIQSRQLADIRAAVSEAIYAALADIFEAVTTARRPRETANTTREVDRPRRRTS